VVLKVQEETFEKEMKEIIKVCEENNVTIEEVKEISDAFNYEDQFKLGDEEILGAKQIILMNSHAQLK
jgi:DNA-binding transcriptional MerR regulator